MTYNRIEYIEKLTFSHTGSSNKKTIVSIAHFSGKLIFGITNEHEDGTAFDLNELQQIYQMLEKHKDLFLQSTNEPEVDRGVDLKD